MNKTHDIVLTALKRTERFMAAQEIHQEVNKKAKVLGLTTIYRALASLSDEKVIDVLKSENGEVGYRLCTPGHHHHLVCDKCQSIVEIGDGPIDKWVTKTAIDSGFTPTSHTIEIRGICKSCSKAQLTN